MGKVLLLMALPWSAFADTGVMSCSFNFFMDTQAVHTEHRRSAVTWGTPGDATLSYEAPNEIIQVTLKLDVVPYLAGEAVISYLDRSTAAYRSSGSRIHPEQRGNTSLHESWFTQDLPIKKTRINGKEANRLSTDCSVTRTTS